MRDVERPEESRAADFMLEDLQACKVRLNGCLSALRIRNVSECIIIAGPIQGSAFLEGGFPQVKKAGIRSLKAYKGCKLTPCVHKDQHFEM